MVWRCRLKTSSTPPDSYPNYEIDTESIQRKDDYEKVEPHAFVHFAVKHSATSALDAAGRGELILRGKPLKVSLGPENPHHLNEKRRTTIPYKLSDVFVEVGVMRSREEFVVGWRGPHTGVDFLVDPFNGRCKLQFTKDTAFSYKGEAKSAVIKTADDDIKESVPFDLLDDDDPWIRIYRFHAQWGNWVPVIYESPRHRLLVQDEPDFGVPMLDPFFCIQYKEGISFKVLFLVNAVMHKGIINQHQMSEKFFDLLRSRPEEVNTVALKHMCSYKHPVYDAFKALELVQKWLLNNPKLLERPREMNDIVEVQD
ncbi:hypothetical protein DH2020_001876 [Rehmannia glutinosa]|uniref:RNA-directed RNA polymerase n=1 Tax=Rehmannia glutinosa TaxID=99300 RepID=A0ABR0XSM1_REHGL